LVDIAESQGRFHVLQRDADLGFDNMDFILDSKTVVNAFDGGNNNITEFVSIIQNCRQLYSIFFHNFMVDFKLRQVNGIVYALINARSLIIRY